MRSDREVCEFVAARVICSPQAPLGSLVPIRAIEKNSLFVGGARRSTNGGPFCYGLCCKSIFGIWSRNIDSRSDTNEQQRFKRTDAPIRLLQISISQSLLGDFCNTIVMQSDRKSRLITICMLASALVMIGLALTGTLQMRVSHSPITRVVPN
jgi:hypothetical protein